MKIENFIRENRKEFDQFEVPDDVWGKIEYRLDQEKIDQNSEFKPHATIRWNYFIKVAVVIVPLILIAFGFYTYQIKQLSELSNIDPVMAQQQMHYASLIEIKRSELKKIEEQEPQLYKEFSSELKKMDLSYQKLKNELPLSPNQEETIKAMIRNLQIQTEILNQQLQIIQQINQIKKNEKNGTQDI